MAIDKLGPYQLNSIHCGECSQMMAELPDECIDLVVTSPPYDNLRMYNSYEFNFEVIAQQLWRVIKVGGVVVWVVGDETKNGSETGTSFRQALGFMSLGFLLHDTMIYDKNGFRFPSSNRYHQVFEFMFVFSKNPPKTVNLLQDKQNVFQRRNHKKQKRERDGTTTWRKRADTRPKGIRFNIWRYVPGGPGNTKDKIAHQHPAIFPESLARDHIITWSNPGNVVLDPMVGSGTTAKMAYQLQRHYLGFDISQEYVNLANKRLAQTQSPLPIEDV